MSAELVMLEAALFQLRSEAETVDESAAPQFDLTLSVLANAIAQAHDGVNAARVSDIEFAINDLAAAVDELPATEANRLQPIVDMMRADVDAMKQQTALAPDTVARITAITAKLKARRSAIERQTYRAEGTEPAPLPHPPEALREEALPLRELLAAAGFATPALDALIDAPEELRFHSISAILDELEVIAG
jgi:hypothetical protein